MADICKHKGKRLLLVEGKNDCHVILALCKAHCIPETFGIYDCGGDDKLLRRLNALIVEPDAPEIIGVVMDTDGDKTSGIAAGMERWQQIRNKIEAHGYIFPEIPEQDGAVMPAVSHKPRIGIWLMPNNQDAGMLEDFLIKIADPTGIAIAGECVEMAVNKGITTFKPVHRSKAVIHTWLAWQDEPGKTPGQSITAHNLSPDMPMALKFTAWLTRLFADEK